MKKTLIIFLILVLLLIGYNYLYQDHRDIQNENPEFVLTAEEIKQNFLNNSEIASSKYLNKTIVVSGKITELNKSDLTLNGSIFCKFNEEFGAQIRVSDIVKIKGRCIGYDDLLEEIKLDQCSKVFH